MKKSRKKQPEPLFVQTARTREESPLPEAGEYLSVQELSLYEALRANVPVIDAAIHKIIRLVGGFTVTCRDPAAQLALNRFIAEVPAGGGSIGLEPFLNSYLDSLLTYGNAVGEIVLDQSRRQVAGLYNSSLRTIEIRRDPNNPLGRSLFFRGCGLADRPVRENGLILFTALNPKAGQVVGNSLLRGLPFVTQILMKIFESTGQNFERIGNIRYAVTYRPGEGQLDKAYASERAAQIAKEWSSGMADARNGCVTDFVSVGDVDIKVIGADSQILSTEVPVRQMLEQIVAKLGIPPFLLGLNWSTTERMSKQQADILTSELACYRRLLAPVIVRICRVFLRLSGYAWEPEIRFQIINLQDEGEMARARLYNAQAALLEQQAAEEQKKL